MNLSVIIPTFNRCSQVLEAIASVLEQAHFEEHGWAMGEQFELIVVDDGSTDETECICKARYPAVTVLRQPNLGVSRARNAGIEASNGQWIAFLDSDDVWLPTKLSAQFALLEISQRKVCHTEEHWIREDEPVTPKRALRKQGGDLFAECIRHCAIAPSAVLIERCVFDEIGVFDESLPVCEDYDLWLRLSARYKVDLLEAPQVIRRAGHADQLSVRYVAMDRFRIRALINLLTSTPLSASQQALAVANLQTRIAIVHKGALKHQNHALIEWTRKLQNEWGDSAHSILEVKQ